MPRPDWYNSTGTIDTIAQSTARQGVVCVCVWTSLCARAVQPIQNSTQLPRGAALWLRWRCVLSILRSKILRYAVVVIWSKSAVALQHSIKGVASLSNRRGGRQLYGATVLLAGILNALGGPLGGTWSLWGVVQHM